MMPARPAGIRLYRPGGPLSLALLLLLAANPARGQDSWAGSVGFATDNVYRGLSMTAGRPAWLTDIHRSFGEHWTAGLAASAERPAYQHAGAQLTAYLQRHWLVGDDWALQAAVAFHDSPWNRYRNQARYSEASLAVGFRGRWNASIAISPDYTGYYTGRRDNGGTVVWLESNLEQPLSDRLSAQIGAGHAESSAARMVDYSYASAGLRLDLAPLYLFVSWIHTTPVRAYYGHPLPRRNRWVGSAIWTFR